MALLEMDSNHGRPATRPTLCSGPRAATLLLRYAACAIAGAWACGVTGAAAGYGLDDRLALSSFLACFVLGTAVGALICLVCRRDPILVVLVVSPIIGLVAGIPAGSMLAVLLAATGALR